MGRDEIVAVAQCDQPLLRDINSRPAAVEVPEAVLAELTELAMMTDSVPTRSRRLFRQLSKMAGQPRLIPCLLGIQTLAQRGEDAGARLLAAYLDAATPGSLLLPRIQRFSSTRRLLCKLAGGVRSDSTIKDWQHRLATCVSQAEAMLESAPQSRPDAAAIPDNEGFYPLLRTVLQEILARCRKEGGLAAEEQSLLAELIRLEVDAYQERISQLAGEVDPFRVTAVTRVLPLLSQADATTHDLRRLISWIEEGNYEAAFQRPVSRSHDVLDEKERRGLEAALTEEEALEPLAILQAGLRENPLPVPQLAGKMTRLLALGRQLLLAGQRQGDLDLLTAVHLIQSYDRAGELRLPLSAELAELIGSWLIAQQTEAGAAAAWLLEGLEVKDGDLILRDPDLGMSDRVWRHDLPTLAELIALSTPPEDTADQDEEAAEDEDDQDLTVAAIKKLVINNIDSVSIVLGFLRNPKIVGIPGLVATVATRARSARLVEVIATERRLYTGHANQDVPLACLRSPCNVSVKTLRKFVQVKYVAKVDLRALVKDKGAVRPEVVAEVRDYLDSLV